MSGETTRRTVRIEDGLWDEAKAATKERGDNLSEVIRQALIHYITSQPNNDKERHVSK